jgi:hypothetical protein
MRGRELLPLVANSLAAIRAECPEAYRRLCAALGGRSARFDVDGEVIFVRSNGGEVEAGSDARGANVTIEVTAGRRALLDLIDGRQNLEEAVLEGGVDARGGVEDLIALHDGLRWYVAGSVRAPSSWPLSEAFRAIVEEEPRGERS